MAPKVRPNRSRVKKVAVGGAVVGALGAPAAIAAFRDTGGEAQTDTGQVDGTAVGADAFSGMPTGATGETTQSYTYTPYSYAQGFAPVRIEVDEFGNRVAVPVNSGQETWYRPEDAQLIFMQLAQTEGGIDYLKEQLWYAGFYGDNAPYIGGDLFDDDDLTAMSQALGLANMNGYNEANAGYYDYINVLAEQGRKLGGALGTDIAVDETPIGQIRKFAEANDLTLSDDFIEASVRQISMGRKSTDDVIGVLREKYVKSAYPAWADAIDAGANVRDLASPYIERAASLLELDPEQIKVSDPVITKALQGVDDKGNPSYVPLWKFEENLRKDDRFAYTKTAHQEMASLMGGVLRQMGFDW